MKILIIQLYRLGDVLQTTPVLQALKKKYGNVEIDFVVDETCVPLIKNNPYISELIVLYRKRFKNTAVGDFIGTINAIQTFFGKIRRKKYDLAINYIFNPAGGTLLEACIAKEKRGYLYRNGNGELLDSWTKYLFAMSEIRHHSLINLTDIFKHIAGCGGISSSLYCKKNKNDDRFINILNSFKRPAPIVVVQGGASNIYKCFNPLQNGKLCTLLSENFNVIYLAAGWEKSPYGYSGKAEHFIDLTGKTDIYGMISIIAGADIVVTPDTITSHVSAALGKKTVCYYLAGVSPYETAPYASGIKTISAKMNCIPCNKPANCFNRLCVNFITPEIVAAETLKMYNNSKSGVYGSQIQIMLTKKDEYLSFDNDHKKFIYDVIKGIDLIFSGKKPKILERGKYFNSYLTIMNTIVGYENKIVYQYH